MSFHGFSLFEVNYRTFCQPLNNIVTSVIFYCYFVAIFFLVLLLQIYKSIKIITNFVCITLKVQLNLHALSDMSRFMQLIKSIIRNQNFTLTCKIFCFVRQSMNLHAACVVYFTVKIICWDLTANHLI